MRILILTLLFACLGCFAQTEEELIKQMGDEDFDLRQKATAALSEYDSEYAEKFIRRASDEPDPEIRYRLVIAAQNIFEKKILPKTEKWRQLWGTLNLNVNQCYIPQKQIEEPGGPAQYTTNFIGYFVIGLDRDAAQGIEDGDLIVEIDGKTPEFSYPGFDSVADQEYEITLRRYKDAEKYIEAQGINDFEDTNFQTLKIKVKAGWKKSYDVDMSQASNLYNKLWKEYVNSIKKAGEE